MSRPAPKVGDRVHYAGCPDDPGTVTAVYGRKVEITWDSGEVDEGLVTGELLGALDGCWYERTGQVTP